MNASIRKVTLVLGLAFLALIVHLNYVQLARSTDLSEHPNNRRQAFEEEGIRRGEILAADGSVLATSVRTGDDRFVWARRYPRGPLFGHITGYYTSPFFCRSSGVEATQNGYLTGEEPATAQDFVDELLGRKRPGNRIKLTISPKLQALARTRFGDQRGGAAVLDSSTGAVLALYGNPTYDPNDITKQKLGECASPQQRLDRAPTKPLLSRAFQVRYPPGSTFKIITAAAGIELGKMSLSTHLRVSTRLDLPNTTRTLGNFGGSTCGGSLRRSFEVSCNTAFAQVALRVGYRKLATMSERFGLGSNLGFDLSATPSCVVSPQTGSFCEEPTYGNAFPPYVGIGQQSVGVTPLQMAVVGAAVANGGYLMRPHVVSKVLDADNAELRTIKPQQLGKRIYSKRTASMMQQLMKAVVCNGTGRIVGFAGQCRGTGGKTGTAQVGIKGVAPHVWFVAFHGRYAVAVVVENGGSLASEATGGKVAGPIAKALLEYAVARKLKG